METLYQMFINFSDGLYAMWIINIILGVYAVYVLTQYSSFLTKHLGKLGNNQVVSNRILQAFSGIFIIIMFLGADIWAASYYTMHSLSPLEFFFYAFDAVVIRHLSEEATRFTHLTK